MNLSQHILDNQLTLLFQRAVIGLEKESQRIDAKGNIVTTDHPSVFGNRSYHPYIQTDFAESQMELITPPNDSIKETHRWLSAIHEVVLRSLSKEEYLFPMSMPPKLSTAEKIRVAQLDNPKDRAYRDYLATQYGKAKQMVSGVHYNFELHSDFIQALFESQSQYVDKQALQNALYLKMAKNFLRYQWVLLYLLSASPIVDSCYFKKGSPLKAGQFVRSLRSSQYGYVNDPEIKVCYDTLESYVQSLEHWVKTGKLIAEKEFYSNVRFRGVNAARELLSKGVRYLEFRLFDLNPFEPFGISLEDMQFIHMFFLLMVWIDETADQQQVELGREYLNTVALENPHAQTVLKAEGQSILQQMLTMLEHIQSPMSIQQVVQEKLQQFEYPEKTVCGRLVTAILKEGDYQKLGIKLAKQYKEQALTRFYAISAFDRLELSTQAIVFDAIQKGVQVEFLDENDQFLRLSHQNHIEYVKNGNMTSHDSYIAPLMMENKVVTKKILAEQGLNVPKSKEVRCIEDAVASYSLFANKPLVIKPKSTNFGLGITIFQQGVPSLDDFKQAITIALREDNEVMLEDYLKGTEYRFFVLGDKTLAVLLRVPANVVGDGQHTIEQLVALKNSDPLRGDGVRSPLKKIALGEIEQLQLKEQGYTLQCIPPKGKRVQLRANSNISTGGDSIDMTEVMHPSYKALAVKITHAMQAKVCGVDMIIPDLTQPADTQQWGVIEANFNPMMMMHIFPYQGDSHRVSQAVLQMLFPELDISH